MSHNDFHHNNLLLDASGELYFSDFEAVTLDERWVLADMIHFAVGTQQFRIDAGIILDYHALLAERTDLAIDLPAQLRFGLLLRVAKLALSSVPPPEVVGQYQRFLQEVLLDDEAFDGWMKGNLEQIGA